MLRRMRSLRDKMEEERVANLKTRQKTKEKVRSIKKVVKSRKKKTSKKKRN